MHKIANLVVQAANHGTLTRKGFKLTSETGPSVNLGEFFGADLVDVIAELANTIVAERKQRMIAAEAAPAESKGATSAQLADHVKLISRENVALRECSAAAARAIEQHSVRIGALESMFDQKFAGCATAQYEGEKELRNRIEMIETRVTEGAARSDQKFAECASVIAERTSRIRNLETRLDNLVALLTKAGK